jgi:hypothetical protein
MYSIFLNFDHLVQNFMMLKNASSNQSIMPYSTNRKNQGEK